MLGKECPDLICRDDIVVTLERPKTGAQMRTGPTVTATFDGAQGDVALRLAG